MPALTKSTFESLPSASAGRKSSSTRCASNQVGISGRRFNEVWTPPASSLSSSLILVLSGLEGIGRRSYLDRVCRDALGLTLGAFFHLDETRALDDLYLWALDETSDLGTRSNQAAEIHAFSRLPEPNKVDEIVK